MLGIRTITAGFTHAEGPLGCAAGTKSITDALVRYQYALSAKMLQPASKPHHYTRLVEAFEKSAQGIARPWWKIFFGIW